MGLALWCNAKEAGHAFSDHAAILVAGKAGTFHFCGPHSYDAFKKAMVITGEERECRLHYPPVGDVVLRCDKPVLMPPQGKISDGGQEN
jgi:hypothetical protein